MTGALLVMIAVLATGPGEDPAPDRAAYEAARKHAGGDADAQVRLALWCERHGMTAERMKHLAAAVLTDPSNALARGLLGLVARDGKWERPDDISREAKEDPRRAAIMQEYLARRAKAADRADDQWKLASWCEQNGLKEQAIAHYHAVLRLDPHREAAWRHLGFKKVGGRWVKPEWQEAARREADEQARANKHWKPILERWRSGLFGRDKGRRADDEAALAGVTDPRAVPMIWSVFVPKGAEGQKLAVRTLGQVDSPGSSLALALLALSSKSPEARGQAMQILRRRDPRDFAPLLIGLIRDPIKYEVKPVNGPGRPGELVIHDGTTNRKRLYTPLSEPSIPLGPNDVIVMGPDGLPVVQRMVGDYIVTTPASPNNLAAGFGVLGPGQTGQVAGALEKAGLPAAQSQKLANTLVANSESNLGYLMLRYGIPTLNSGYLDFHLGQYLQIPVGQMELDAQRSAQVARLQLAGDVQAIEAYNAPIREMNRRARQILSEAAGTDLADDHAAWTRWLVDLFGYAIAAQKASPDETTIIEQVPLSYQPQAPPVTVQAQLTGVSWHHSCFGGGTPVRTLDGLRPIESLRAGDLVLAQDLKSGELKYQAVVAAYHNPPNATYRVALDDGESIVATGIHRLWKAGQGWTMTRDLKPGDVLRTLGGVATVRSVEAEKTQPVHNLKVAEGESYFVGSSGVLAHDNSTINPVPKPFDAVGPLTAAAKSDRSSKPRSMLGR
jgi:hypothetical protein